VDLMFDVVTLQAFNPNYVARLTNDAAEQSRETLRVLAPGEDCRLAWQELRNKYEVFTLVKNVRTLVNEPADGDFPLGELIERAYALGAYPDLWAVEGLGHDYAARLWRVGDPIRGILTDARSSVLPVKSLTMMHAGLGLAFAERLMEIVTPYSPAAEIRRVLDEFITLCRDNSRAGYVGAAYESLGLVTRTWHARMVSIVDRQLREIDEEVAGYFWHGVGRALYFLPIYFVPGLLSPWRAVEREPPDDFAGRNALAGLAWAMTLVNMRQPEIMANLLRHRGARLSQTDAFANGVSSSIIVGHDITPGDIYITAFCRYQPSASEPRLMELWNDLVGRPCRDALARFYPVLQRHDRLGEVFHYQSLPRLIARLEGGAGAEN